MWEATEILTEWCSCPSESSKDSIQISLIMSYYLYEDTETLYPDGLEGVPLRYAIVHRNRWMVEHSQHIIAYVTHGWGGAAATLKVAQNRKLQIKQIFSTKKGIIRLDDAFLFSCLCFRAVYFLSKNVIDVIRSG